MFRRAALIAAGAALLGVGGAHAQQPPAARADVRDAQGKSVGEVLLTQHPQGVLVRAELSGLPSGWHGFHIHEVGKCDAPKFESAES